MGTPSNWKTLVLPHMISPVPWDTVFTTRIGAGTGEAWLQVRRAPYISFMDVSTRQVLDAYDLSRSTAKLLAVATDSANNSVIVDYLAEYQGRPPLLYFRDVFLIQGRTWVSVDFHGPDSRAFRDTVKQMTESIKVIKI